MGKPEKKLGQILVDNGKVSNTDIKNALVIQKKNARHKLLGEILMDLNLISKDDLISALNEQLQHAAHEIKAEVNLGDEDEIKRIVDKYKESEYFADLNELIGVITHKIRNPLAGISAAAEVLRDKVGTNNTNEKFFEMIFKEIDRLDEIVKNIFKAFSNK